MYVCCEDGLHIFSIENVASEDIEPDVFHKTMIDKMKSNKNPEEILSLSKIPLALACPVEDKIALVGTKDHSLVNPRWVLLKKNSDAPLRVENFILEHDSFDKESLVDVNIQGDKSSHNKIVHRTPICGMQASLNGEIFLAISLERKVFVYKLAEQKLVHEEEVLSVHNRPVFSLSQNGLLMACLHAEKDKHKICVNFVMGEKFEFDYNGKCSYLKFNSDGKYLAAADENVGHTFKVYFYNVLFLTIT